MKEIINKVYTKYTGHTDETYVIIKTCFINGLYRHDVDLNYALEKGKSISIKNTGKCVEISRIIRPDKRKTK